MFVRFVMYWVTEFCFSGTAMHLIPFRKSNLKIFRGFWGCHWKRVPFKNDKFLEVPHRRGLLISESTAKFHGISRFFGEVFLAWGFLCICWQLLCVFALFEQAGTMQRCVLCLQMCDFGAPEFCLEQILKIPSYACYRKLYFIHWCMNFKDQSNRARYKKPSPIKQ